MLIRDYKMSTFIPIVYFEWVAWKARKQVFALREAEVTPPHMGSAILSEPSYAPLR